MKTITKVQCHECKRMVRESTAIDSRSVRPEIIKKLKNKIPSGEPAEICPRCLDAARIEYFKAVLLDDKQQLDELEAKVLDKLGSHQTISQDPVNQEIEKPPTFGARLADKVASFGGSWTFISIFGGILIAWIVTNSFLATKAFDPFPFILLNLVLSSLAAFQAPIIMMSQNRQSQKDRQSAENDYLVNLKSELEIRFVHEKLDHLLYTQMQNLIEIQDLQMQSLQRIESYSQSIDTLQRSTKKIAKLATQPKTTPTPKLETKPKDASPPAPKD